MRVSVRETDESQTMLCSVNFRLQQDRKDMGFKELHIYELVSTGRGDKVGRSICQF